MRYEADHKQETHERLLKEAAMAIRASGPAGLSLSGVMKSAGLTNGGFYAHFKSRDQLLEAGVGQLFRESSARSILERDGNPGENLVEFVRFYLSRKHRDATTFGCPLALLSSEAPRLPPRAAKRYAEGMESLAALIGGTLKALGEEHAEDEASSLLSELIGALSRARAEPDPQKSDLILMRSKRTMTRRFDLQSI